MNRLLIIIFFIPLSGWAQNLVSNPSFEEHQQCPEGNGQIFLAESWINVYGGNDYFHECGINGWTVPQNSWGYEDARTGQAYGDISLWAKPFLGREYIGVPLMDTLISGKKYNVELYISFMDSVCYAVKNIGVYFSEVQPDPNINTLLSKEPQVKYQGVDFLIEKDGWTKIEGSFIADGEETFLTIGNFDYDEETDTVFVSGGGYVIYPVGYWDNAGYYIDDVSVTLDTTTNINEAEHVQFKIYPNPASDIITIQTEQAQEKTVLQLTDITGRVVFSSLLRNTKTSIDVSALPEGIYFYNIFINDLKQQTGKQIIIK